MLVGFLYTLDEGVAEGAEDYTVVAWQILKETFAEFQNFITELLMFGKFLRAGAKVENVSQHIDRYL